MIKNLSLMLIAFAILYIPIEIVWRNSIMLFPVNLHEQLGRLKPLAQNSKGDIVPKDYTLIVGDSYAEGLGDWFMQKAHDINPTYNAGHVLHELSGQDVLSFGYRGGFPSDTVVRQTTKDILGLKKYLGINISPPSRVLVFFYEGNDIADELAAIDRMNIDQKKFDDLDYIKSYISTLSVAGANAASKRWYFLRNAHLIDTGSKLAKLMWKNIVHRGRKALSPDDGMIAGYSLLGKNYRENWQRYQSSSTMIYVGGKPNKYPKETVEPIAFHNSEQRKRAGNIFKASLEYLNNLFPDAVIWTVYIPSPMNAYRFLSKSIVLNNRVHQESNLVRGGPTRFIVSEVFKSSDLACREIRNATYKVAGKFIDTRRALQEISSRDGYVHGPNDPSHFNERGYRALAAIIHRNLEGELDDTCNITEILGSQ